MRLVSGGQSQTLKSTRPAAILDFYNVTQLPYEGQTPSPYVPVHNVSSESLCLSISIMRLVPHLWMYVITAVPLFVLAARGMDKGWRGLR